MKPEEITAHPHGHGHGHDDGHGDGHGHGDVNAHEESGHGVSANHSNSGSVVMTSNPLTSGAAAGNDVELNARL